MPQLRPGEGKSGSVVSDSLWPHGLYSPWNFPGRNTGVGSSSLLQEIFPTQGSNPGLLHCRRILYQLSYEGSPQWPEKLKNCYSIICGLYSGISTNAITWIPWSNVSNKGLVCYSTCSSSIINVSSSTVWDTGDPWTRWVWTIWIHLHAIFFQ